MFEREKQSSHSVRCHKISTVSQNQYCVTRSVLFHKISTVSQNQYCVTKSTSPCTERRSDNINLAHRAVIFHLQTEITLLPVHKGATLSLQTRTVSEFARWDCHRSRGPGHTISPNKGTIRICKMGLSQRSWSFSTPVATLTLQTRTLSAFPRCGCHRSRSPFPHTPS